MPPGGGKFPLAAASALALVLGCGGESRELTVYAPASMTEAIEEAGRVFADSLGIQVITRTGASGTLASAIGEGAPADVFISADPVWIDYLTSKALLVDGSARILAWNRMALAVPAAADSLPSNPVELLRLRRLAIGDPDTVPVGRYARQALTNLGIWDLLESRTVFAQDARAVLALAERGEVDGAFVYESDAQASKRVRVGFILPERSHDPVAYPGALVRGSRRPKAAARFLEFLSSARGRGIFIDHGFLGT